MNDLQRWRMVPLSGFLEFVVLQLEQALVQRKPGIAEHYREMHNSHTMQQMRFLRTVRNYYIVRQ